jgi:phage tail-like protein
VARGDPLRGFRYVIEIGDLPVAGFTRVKTLAREVKTESYHEGGVNTHEHKLVTMVTYGNLVLERGLAEAALWGWALDVANGDIKRRNINVVLRNEAGEDQWTWIVENAFPVKWAASDLDGAASQVVMESIEFAHHGLRKGA